MSKTTKKPRRGKREKGPRGERSRPLAASPRLPGASFDKVFEKIYRLVLRIPTGRVMTYGQIASLLEERYSARLVGWAMHATPKDARNIPWHRVINSRGAISTGRVILHQPELQRLMLEAEGVVFDERGHCDLSLYQWSPRQKAAKAMIRSLRAKKPRARDQASVKPNASRRTRSAK